MIRVISPYARNRGPEGSLSPNKFPEFQSDRGENSLFVVPLHLFQAECLLVRVLFLIRECCSLMPQVEVMVSEISPQSPPLAEGASALDEDHDARTSP